MPLLLSRAAVRRARFKAVVRLYATLAIVLLLFLLTIAVAYIWQHA